MLGKTVDPPAGAGSRDLLEQLQDRIPHAIGLEAKLGYAYLERLRQQSASVQADAVARLDDGHLSVPRGADVTRVTVALVAAALQLVKEPRSTPSERVVAAMAVLSDRFQADW